MSWLEKILGRSEKIPTLAELEKEFAGVESLRLPRIDWSRRSGLTTSGVGFTTTALELYNTSAYKGKSGWQAWLAYEGIVLFMSNFQGEVLPGNRLEFSFRERGSFRGEENTLYLKTAAVTLEGKAYPAKKWIFQFEPPQFGRV